MSRTILSFLALIGFCCLLVACNANSTAPTEQVVDPETRPGAKEGTGPAPVAI